MSRSVVATYRLQLHAGFRFDDARAVVGYLDALGVSHAYASPYLRAAKGSTHGYDLVDPGQLNPEIGDGAAYRAWTDALQARGMGHVVDFVPNHMGIAGGENRWWEDVLENGPSSLYAEYFDVEWDPPKTGLKDRVLLPILGAQYGEVLENGELRLERDGGAFFVRYYERRLPVSPPTTVPLLEDAAARTGFSADDPRAQELASIVTALRHMPASHERDPERRKERAREKEIAKRRLEGLCKESPEVAAAVDAAVTTWNGTKGDARSFDRLDELLQAQCYRPSFWRVATEEINYRRFFEINDLAAVRMETDAVFDEAHALVFREIAEGRLDGLRLDHVDGLYDPEDYLARLRKTTPEGTYLVVEKILEPKEALPDGWPIDGTTGYDFVGAIGALFVDRASLRAMDALYVDVTGDRLPFAEHARLAKRAIMRRSLSAEIHVLARALERIALRNRRSRDFTLASLTTALVETIAAFPVYRTYIRPSGARGPEDEARIARAIRVAKRQNPEMSGTVFDFLQDVLLLRCGADDGACARFVMRFQQTTGPVMAKGVEDTAFYTYARMVALNEVGGSPEVYGLSTEAFHAQNALRLARYPRAMTATSTHDTKRGEDVRARLAVLSEMPDEWRAAVEEWCARGKERLGTADEERAPSAVDEYLLLQTIVGALPFDPGADLGAFQERVAAYMTKAVREAKQRTSWLNPNEAYEQALAGFVRATFADDAVMASVRRLVGRIGTYAATNGLSMALLKIASPGVPDSYQGSESWNLDLVDPDNRRPVDYDRLRGTLERVRAEPPSPALAARLLDTFHDGALKLFVVQAALRHRRANAALYLDGDYAPIDAGEHVVAFARRHAGASLVCAVPRFAYRVTRGEHPWPIGARVWGNATFPVPAPGRYANVLTGETLDLGPHARAADVFASFPAALLFAEGAR